MRYIPNIAKGSRERYWKRQQFKRFAQAMRGRKNRCYGIGIRYVQKQMIHATRGREIKHKQLNQLFGHRIAAAAAEHGMKHRAFVEGVKRSNIALNYQTLNYLAIYEPRTFQSLVEIAKLYWEENPDDKLQRVSAVKPPGPGVITREMLKLTVDDEIERSEDNPVTNK